MFLVVGLGNPGKQYESNRHNVGFRVIAALARSAGSTPQLECRANVTTVETAKASLILAQPLTYVNASGESVRDLMDKYELTVEDLIVVYDDLDLPFGQVRIKAKGSSGGHRGVDSIIFQLGSDEFSRVKIGIGRPPGRQDPADFVLEDFTPKEEEEISIAVEEAADAVFSIIENGQWAAMNRYNSEKDTR